ncbi:16S rRNA (cytosine(1402)-N(4))-methyltransferase RsmH [Gleimia europaea]|uniref:Ribosomal RNA small subunit methyltransferase H n=1 Tax=Gleimia europaea ACS-120-V-Col10b TaxID=883069 RepID=A0A9W5RD65_9ACTO|nr:16S rRNA (cytosine(1402)-N(4))-methyltransferase RsmH [Gleimia europaea]EPD30294.1 S-adenosyl-methyltransferase MraW [Gleimia europaea ACS-120-V-Col10b]
MELSPEAISELHDPVLVSEVLELLEPVLVGGGVLVDGTLGMGGHTEAVLKAFPKASVIGIDRDPRAIELAAARLTQFGSRFTPVLATYDQIENVVARAGLDEVDAVFLDLGVSSLQLDDDERGFSYSRRAPLDMRMDQTSGMSATDLLASASEAELARILRVYGEERFANRIAQRIVISRTQRPLMDSAQLAELVREAIPAATRRSGGHPAKRTFQALRIAVNDELTILERSLPAALSTLRVGGRLAVESYHSLEDRIVKHLFKEGSTPPQLPKGLPIRPSEEPQAPLQLLTRKAIQAPAAEVAINPRAKSVRLRAVQLNTPYNEQDKRSSQ